MMSVWGWIADAVLALLLAGTLVMAIRLDRALTVGWGLLGHVQDFQVSWKHGSSKAADPGPFSIV